MSTPGQEHRLIGDPVPARVRISPEATGIGHRTISDSTESATAPERIERDR
ncbi:hypothetical protein SAMN04487905_10132 [Actinopolyspora xinjiangensis]|uniref:Uncharacterized protein n=1 Tax=Actinopolyspora xinjiangensis TaxID=405564 RepID=A0A1H0N807_9ACTN|nr:hypothetical protein [Actinopolyspora xinjiangensis]SDO88807.1 hypothetical protein SAMN04487905_10132 [Actinopolyspora xinjiangensis]